MLDIFNSKSRDWVTLICQLEDHVVKVAGKNERLILKESYIDYVAQAI